MKKIKAASMDTQRLKILFLSFMKISGITFGGGLAMLPVMQREFVDKRRYFDEKAMVDITAVVQSLPGIIAINSASIIGYRVAKLPGALVSVLAVILPPFFVILAVAYFWSDLHTAAWLEHAFVGVRAAVAAFILASAVRMAKPIFQQDRLFGTLLFAGGAVAMTVFRFSAVYLILIGGAAGLLYSASCARLAVKKAEAGK